MKLNSTAKGALALIGCAFLITPAALRAGEAAETMSVAVEPEMSSLIDPISGAVTIGYDSSYIFRGSNFGNNAPWLALDLSVPLGENLTLDGGIWYVNPATGTDFNPDKGLNDELDYYVSLATTVGAVDIALGYHAYTFPEAGLRGSAENEVGLNLSTAIAMFDVDFGYYYNFNAPVKNYYQLGLSNSYDLSDRVALYLGVAVGFYESEYNATLVTLAMPVVISESTVLEAYVAGSFAGNANIYGLENDDEIFGGVSLSVAF
ncbi:MAG: hypothetical protein ACC661_03070 [Verrucomicrobiales bacterium]